MAVAAGVAMSLKLPPLPEPAIDDLAAKQWPNDEWIGVRYIKCARNVEDATRAVMIAAVADWLIENNECSPRDLANDLRGKGGRDE